MLTHEVIVATADRTPELTAIRFLGAGTEITEARTYGALCEGALKRAGWIGAQGLRGQPVVLVFEPGVLFIETLLACLMSGAIAVPLPVPRHHSSIDRLRAALGDLGNPAILTTSDVADLPALQSLGGPIHRLDRIPGVADGITRAPAAGDPAVIQYSSGSTARPRGIVITQGNIAANLPMMIRAMDAVPGDVVVNWLPHTHDMGLFGTILAPLWVGGTAVLMPPTAFLRRPMRWLQAISDFGGTQSTAPNFGYALAVRRSRPEDIAKLKLAQWRTACVGSEPTLPETLISFADAMRPAGFRPRTFQSCYGLAEATLLCATGRPVLDGGPVSCGEPVPGCKIRLRPTALVPRRGVGEIMIAGDHVSPGTWDAAQPGRIRPLDGTETTDSGDIYVPTGDLGEFVQGRLFIRDRLKDLLPVRGGTLGPVEVEQVVLAQDPLIATATAVPDAKPGSYKVRVAIELTHRGIDAAQVDPIRDRIRDALAERFGIQSEIHNFAPNTLPRTTSGKIQRFAVRGLLTDPEPALVPD